MHPNSLRLELFNETRKVTKRADSLVYALEKLDTNTLLTIGSLFTFSRIE